MYPITIIGLGASDIDQLSVGIYRKMKEASYIIARTKEHPVVAQLKEEQIDMDSFDAIYEQHDAFDAVYETIVERLIALSEESHAPYAVPRHPLVGYCTVPLCIVKEREGLIQ